MTWLLILIPATAAAQDNDGPRGSQEAASAESVVQKVVLGNQVEQQQIARIPDRMDVVSLTALANESHNANGMLPELEVFPQPVLYRLRSLSGPSWDELEDGEEDHVTLKIVRGRFVVQTGHRDRGERSETLIWT